MLVWPSAEPSWQVQCRKESHPSMLVDAWCPGETSQLVPGLCPSSSSVKFVDLASLAGAEATVGKWESSGPAPAGGGSKEEGPGGEGSPS